MDFSALTGAIDVSTVATAIIAVGALIIVPRVAAFGVRWIKRMIA